ncbi:DsrE family protein [Sphingomonas montanisoli]|uniref:Dual specificity protein phosphatase family protein n=1 Tax=Sphingomonas montanisoli TaxID=2606412 RepID=A0A5D9C1Y5_9SPHN|nr:DsrE family protein [Sphingomonas montanisoli]TZG25070.1 dual specificity protein phosphatase family protein [Sphingomonas montanisoli]
MPMLTLIVAGSDPERLHAALTFAAASAAIGDETRLHAHAPAVSLLLSPDATPPAPGLPSIAQAINDAVELGVRITLCQTGLSDAASGRFDIDGPIGVLTAGGRLVVF